MVIDGSWIFLCYILQEKIYEVYTLKKPHYILTCFCTIVLCFLFVILSQTITTYAAEEGWKLSNGRWWYSFSDGSYAKSEYIDGYWLDSEGWYDSSWNGSWKHNKIGWWFQSGSWYPKSEWLRIDKKWYHFDASGYLDIDKWIDGYYVGSDGAWVPDTKNKWSVTSYASVTGNQSMFYVIEDASGSIILIDGGYEADAEQVKKIISAHDNHVSAWIITHPHPDHAGAFNKIMSDRGNIVVDNIYVTDVNYDRYKATAKDYDGFDTCETYWQLIKSMDNVIALKEGDEFSCLGLSMKVLHGWDSGVDKLSSNLCNNGSLMFTVSGTKDSMLFCADTESKVENDIISRHASELSSIKYVQAGHHGNWGLSTKFYDCISSPEKVFFDSTNALYMSDAYDASKLRTYFSNRGVSVVNFSTAPNTVTLE